MTYTRPDPDHDAVCASQHRHLLVTAPPGAGKTHLCARVAGVLADELATGSSRQDIVGARVLLLTFSNQARAQLEAETRQLLSPEQRQRVEVSNYHALALRAVRAHRRALGLPLQAQLVSHRVREHVLKERAGPAYRRLDRAHRSALPDLAEFRFPAFRDLRTPAPDDLTQLLAVIDDEHQAGRYTFGDLGALFWRLLEQHPVLHQAFIDRYPMVIADEHQDASALQDALVRRLAPRKLIILADDLQLIHGWRGASSQRLEQHRFDCDEEFELTTPHRWHAQPDVGAWMMEVRHRLLQHPPQVITPPAGLVIVEPPAGHGFNGLKYPTLQQVRTALRAGARRVAVLASTNEAVRELRTYLTKEGMSCRQSLGGASFDDAHDEIEALRGAASPAAASQLVEQLAALFPGWPRQKVEQVQNRITADGVKLKGSAPDTRAVLEPLQALYQIGTHRSYAVLAAMIEVLREQGHLSPYDRTVRGVRRTAAQTAHLDDIDAVLAVHAEHAGHDAATRTSDDGPGLFVSTIHNAKGKEFDAVIVVDASARHFSIDLDRRRLFYVALTRARSRWVFIAATGTTSPLLAMLR